MKSEYAKEFKIRLNNLLYPEGENKPYWETSFKITENNHLGSYKSKLEKLLEEYICNDSRVLINEIWNKKHTDVELGKNFQRFYLFYEILQEKNNNTLPFKLIENWISINKQQGKSEAWNTMNCSLRLINWVKLFCYTPVEYFPNNERWGLILNSVKLQANHIYRNIEYDISGNHVLLEFFSLWLTGNIFPELKDSEKWIRFSEKNIIKELNTQFCKDGFHYEHCTHYHIQSALTSLIWYFVMATTGRPVCIKIREKLYKAYHVINDFILPDGSVPPLGDCCHPFFHQTLLEDLDNVNRLGKVLFTDDNGSLVNFKKNDNNNSEHYILRKFANSKLIVDVGNIGCKNNPGHGHSDLLSFIYCHNSIPIFIDPGTLSYSNNPESLKYKKSSYHNTISINGADQAKLWRYFRWAFLPDNLSYYIKESDNMFTLQGKYLGFKDIGGFKHKRIFTMEENKLQIEDYIEGKDGHCISLNFILSPNIKLTREGKHIILSSGVSSYLFQYISCLEPVVITEEIFIYREYGTKPVLSTKFTLIFNKAKMPFTSKVEIAGEKTGDRKQ